MEKDTDIVMFEKYDDPIDANIVKGVLESNGINAGVMIDGLSRGLMMVPTRVMVMRRDLERARQVINSPADEEINEKNNQ